jgi:hypothetical protein
MGLASSHRALPEAEESDPGLEQIPEEAGRRPQTEEPPCRSCNVQGTYSDSAGPMLQEQLLMEGRSKRERLIPKRKIGAPATLESSAPKNKM